jgi:hypothetical protein
MKVIITKEIEEWWGLADLKEDYDDENEFHRAATELLREDIDAVLDGATWDIVE